MSDKPQRVVHDTLINLLGATFPVLITLVTVPMYLRTIGDVRYGVLTLVWLIIGRFSLFDLGLGRATTNRLAKIRHAPLEDRTSIFWGALLANLGLGTVGGLGLWVLTGAWGVRLFGIPSNLGTELVRALPFLALGFPLVTTSSVFIGALDAHQDFGRANVVGVLGAGLTAVLPLLGALLFGPTLSVVVAWTVVGRLAAGIAALWACQQAGVFKGFRLGTLREIAGLLRYGGWVSVSNAIGPILVSLDRFMISSQLGAHAVPYYAIPSSVVTRVQVLAGSLQRALFPRFSTQDGESAKRVAVDSVLALSVVMTPILIVVVLLLRPFLGVWLGPDYAQQAGPVGEILVFGIWANSLAFIPWGLLQAEGRPDLTAKFHVVELVPYVLALRIGLTRHGLPGAAFAWSLRVVADAVLLLAAARLLGAAFRDLRAPAVLVAVSSVLTLVLPDSAPLRWAAACGMGVVSAGWAWRVTNTRFHGVLDHSMQVLRRHILPRGDSA